MARYVDGYVLPVPKKRLNEYKKMAKSAGKVWIKYGALNYVEAIGDDMTSCKEWGGVPFPKIADCKPNEVVIFAFVTYRSKKHRDSVNKKVEKEHSEDDCEKTMPFEMKRMAFGGFETIVDL